MDPVRRPHRRPVRTLVLGLVPVVALAGCTGSGGGTTPPNTGDGAQRAATALASALSKQDVSALPWSGLTGAQAQTEFRSVTSGLGSAKLTATSTQLTPGGRSATATFTLGWTFPGVTQPWTYPVTAQLTEEGDVWKPVWTPTMLQPDLVAGGRLSLTRTQGKRGDILAGDGSALMTERDVRRIGIDKTEVSGDTALSSAAKLAALVDVNSKNFVTAVKNAGSQAFVPAIVFRKNAADAPSRGQLATIKGALAVDGQAVLPPSQGFALPLLGQVGEASKEVIDKSDGTIVAGDQVGLSGLEQRDEKQLGGTPTVTVRALPPSGSTASPTAGSSPSASPSESSTASSSGASPIPSPTGSAAGTAVFTSAGKDGTDLKLTLDPGLQRSAEQVLASVRPDSALVAVQPSTGKILAAASGPGSDGNNTATYGQFPPGSTFKLASSLALLRAGMKPGTAVNCPKTLVVNGQTFKNYSDYPSSSLGRIDLETAVAQSCNTAFIGSRTKLSGTDLADAAGSLGIGIDYDVGFPAYYGSVPKPGSENEKAASMIGQAKVQASPMAMAGAIASAQRGRTVLPYLVDGMKPTSKGKPLTGNESQQLRTMLGAVVTQGSGARLRALEPPTVIAKTGTAEFGTDDPPKTHAWMVAAQGDLAVAVFVGLGDTGSQTAGPLLESFLKKAQ